MTESRYLHLRGALGAVKTEMWEGREHLVVPCVALQEGVIHAVNAASAEFVPAAALTRSAGKWQGHPLVVGHPVKNGRQISAHDPAVLAQHGFGIVRRDYMNGPRLGIEALIDPARLEALGQQKLLTSLRAGEPIEVSVGAFVTTNDKTGRHNGRDYSGEWVDITPDHFAFLPGGTGACSLAAGCGANRAAQTYLVTASAFEVLGGPGSGNFGHEGRPGEVGGSGDGDGSGSGGDGKSKSSGGGGDLQRAKEHMDRVRKIVGRANVDETGTGRWDKRGGHPNARIGKIQDNLKKAGYVEVALDSNYSVHSNDVSHGRVWEHPNGSTATLSRYYGETQHDNSFSFKVTPPDEKNAETHKERVHAISGRLSPDERVRINPGSSIMQGGKHATVVSYGKGSVEVKIDGEKESSWFERRALRPVKLKGAESIDDESEVRTLSCAHLETIRTLLDEVDNLHDEAEDYADKLFAADEAGEETDQAQLEALEVLCMSMSSMLSSVVGVAYKKRFGPPPAVGSPEMPRYAELRAAYGKTISAATLKVIQASHDSAHQMHDHTVGLGAECNGMKVLGGPGSGWTAENGHVPGSNGGSKSDSDRRANDGHGGSPTPVEGDRVKVMGKVHGAGKKGTVSSGSRDGSFVYVKDAKGETLGSYHVSDLKVLASGMKDCPACKGSGNLDGNPCEACDGAGELKIAEGDPMVCEACNGTGKVDEKDCAACSGSGELKTAGGPGSGNFGHSGRPGEVGGSGDGGGSGSGPKYTKDSESGIRSRFWRGDEVQTPDGKKGTVTAVYEDKGKVIVEVGSLSSEAPGRAHDEKDLRAPSKSDGGFSVAEIDAVDSVATRGFNSVSSRDLDETDTALRGILEKSITNSQEFAEKAAKETGSVRRKLMEDAAFAYGRAQKLANIYAKQTGKKAPPVYAPLLSHMKTAEQSADQLSAAELDQQLLSKAAAGEAAFRAACGCQGATIMTQEQRAETIKTLVECKFSGFTKGDEKMLEGASDERLESFRVAAESRASTEKDLRAAAERKLTAEEFMQVAPPELRSLITKSQRQETEHKAALITTLKAAQSEYSEAELSVMDVDQLARMARMAKVEDKVDYSGRGVARAAAAADEDDYTPPNPYEPGLKALAAQRVQ